MQTSTRVRYVLRGVIVAQRNGAGRGPVTPDLNSWSPPNSASSLVAAAMAEEPRERVESSATGENACSTNSSCELRHDPVISHSIVQLRRLTQVGRTIS